MGAPSLKITVLVTAPERHLLRQAASRAHLTMSNYVRRALNRLLAEEPGAPVLNEQASGRPRHRYGPASAARAKALRDLGCSWATIAARLGCSRSETRALVARDGTDRR